MPEMLDGPIRTAEMKNHATVRADGLRPCLYLLALAFALLSLNGCRPSAAPETRPTDLANLDVLLQLMRQRLELMHDVAKWKWTANKPIADPQRESELLESVVQIGGKKGLDPNLTRSFFSAQIDAARLIQQLDFDRWNVEKQAPFPDTPSLAALRERIDALNIELIDALTKLNPQLGNPSFQQALQEHAQKILTGEGLVAARETAIAPLRR
jgi:chorismate mutase